MNNIDLTSGCGHLNSVLCRRTFSNGTIHVQRQCQRCGQAVGGCVAKATVPDIAALPAWDARIGEDYDGRPLVERQMLLIAEDPAKSDFYATHLRSDYWRAIRGRVLQRDGGICQFCLNAGAKHVHHLTYDRLGHEAAYDLVSVCVPCHEEIHGRKFGDAAVYDVHGEA